MTKEGLEENWYGKENIEEFNDYRKRLQEFGKTLEKDPIKAKEFLSRITKNNL